MSDCVPKPDNLIITHRANSSQPLKTKRFPWLVGYETISRYWKKQIINMDKVKQGKKVEEEKQLTQVS